MSQSVQGGPQKPVVSRGWKNHSKTNFLKPFIGGHIYIYIYHSEFITSSKRPPTTYVCVLVIHQPSAELSSPGTFFQMLIIHLRIRGSGTGKKHNQPTNIRSLMQVFLRLSQKNTLQTKIMQGITSGKWPSF